MNNTIEKDDMKNVNNETNNHADVFDQLCYKLLNQWRRNTQSLPIPSDVYNKNAVLRVIKQYFKKDPRTYGVFLDLLFDMVETKYRGCDSAKIDSNGINKLKNDYIYWELIKSSRDNKEELSLILSELYRVDKIVGSLNCFDDCYTIDMTLRFLINKPNEQTLINVIQIILNFWNHNLVFEEDFNIILSSFCEEVPKTLFGAKALEEEVEEELEEKSEVLEDDDTYW